MEYEPKRAIYLPLEDFVNLEFHLMDTRPGANPDAFVAELVKRWLALEMERLALRKNGQATRGFQWKNVFLPDGTNLRTSYLDAVEFAKVAGDRILSSDGESLTPSLFANRHTKGRNAWRFVWLRFPGDDYWIRADDHRARFAGLATSVSACRSNSVRRQVTLARAIPGRVGNVELRQLGVHVQRGAGIAAEAVIEDRTFANAHHFILGL